MFTASLQAPAAVRPRVARQRTAPAAAAAARGPQRAQQRRGEASLSLSARRDVRAFAATKDEVKPEINPVETAPEQATKWHYVVANADFMLNDVNNEPLPEVLRERRRYLLEVGKPINFFVVQNPAWLDKIPEGKRVRRPSAAIVCPDPVWITCVPSGARVCPSKRSVGPIYLKRCVRPRRFVKLRLDRVLKGEIDGTIEEATASTGPVPKFPAPATWEAPYNKYAYGWWDMFTYKK